MKFLFFGELAVLAILAAWEPAAMLVGIILATAVHLGMGESREASKFLESSRYKTLRDLQRSHWGEVWKLDRTKEELETEIRLLKEDAQQNGNAAEIKRKEEKLQENEKERKKLTWEKRPDEVSPSPREQLEQLIENREAWEKIGTNPIERMMLGNPTSGGGAISQLGLWMMLFLTGVVVSAHLEFHNWWMVTFPTMLGVVFVLYAAFLHRIPSPPPHRGIYLLLGVRKRFEYREGWVLLVPFIEDFSLVNIKKRDYDQDHLLRTKDNAEVTVSISVVWRPDPDRLKRYSDVGDDEIISLLDSNIDDSLRDHLYNHTYWRRAVRHSVKKEWESTDSPGGQKQRLVDKFVDEQYLLQPWEDAQGMGKHELREVIIRSLTTGNGPEDLDPNIGLPDDQGWGIRIMNVYISRILLEGEARKAAELRAKEVGERRGEEYEKQTEAGLAEIFMDRARRAGVTLSFDEALRMVLDYKSTQDGHGLALPGVSGPLDSILRTLMSKGGIIRG